MTLWHGRSYAVVIILDGVIFLSASAKVKNEISFSFTSGMETGLK